MTRGDGEERQEGKDRMGTQRAREAERKEGAGREGGGIGWRGEQREWRER